MQIGRPVVFVTDQNFPAVLPSAENRCLAIMRMEQASMDDLADMFIKLAKTTSIPASTVIVVGSLSHLSRVGTHTVTRIDMIFRYPDRVPLTHFVHRAKKVFSM
jgi:hypothetical protein